jgi:RNA polymerase subunit RPABC4/transcription elongation factor Spt4
MPCRFCEEAQRLLQRLAEEQPVRLCTRCGSLLDEAEEGEYCRSCRLALARPSLPLRREDRVAAWLQRLLEPPTAGEQRCPGCGRAVPAFARYCPQCGVALISGAEAKSAATAPGASGTPETLPQPKEVESRYPVPAGAQGGRGTWYRVSALLRSWFHPGSMRQGSSGWLWLLLGLLLLGLLGIGLFWAQLLRSRDIFFR